VSVAGVELEAGEAVIQLGALETLRFSTGPLLFTDTLCVAGAVPPIWWLKESEAGVTAMPGAVVTVSVTGMVCGLFAAPPAAIVTVPVNIPSERPAGLTETLKLAGVAAVPGVTASQPTGELAVALRLRVGPLLTTDTLCAAGVAPPIW
jgi:hypothetical protein